MKNMGGIIKVAIMAAIAYYGYQYLVSSGLWAQWFGGAAPPQPTGGSGGAIATSSGPSAAVQQQLATMGAAYKTNTGSDPNVDSWVYYYQQAKGITLSGGQVDNLITALGLNSATRATPIPLSAFVAAMAHVGLSGIVHVPNAGPIAAPLPTQSFGGGFGGYGNGGYSRKGNGYVQ